MAKTDQRPASATAIDSILRGLTQRPNVESTLILSRKDGSVIRALGHIAGSGEQASLQNLSSSLEPSREDNNNGPPVPGSEDIVTPAATVNDSRRKEPSPAERLACSIYQFVQSATTLGTTLNSPADTTKPEQRHNDGGMPSANAKLATGSAAAEDEDDENGDENNVQLLRLRTRAQEIIIFPNPDYLCCVVQRVGKSAAGVGER